MLLKLFSAVAVLVAFTGFTPEPIEIATPDVGAAAPETVNIAFPANLVDSSSTLQVVVTGRPLRRVSSGNTLFDCATPTQPSGSGLRNP